MCFVAVLRTCRNLNAGTFRVAHELAPKINLKFALDHETEVSLFAPLWFDELACELHDAKLLAAVAEHLKTSAGHQTLPGQGVEINLKRLHGPD
jgi:hypothetical protein